jgi:hypothetical protein
LGVSSSKCFHDQYQEGVASENPALARTEKSSFSLKTRQWLPWCHVPYLSSPLGFPRVSLWLKVSLWACPVASLSSPFACLGCSEHRLSLFEPNQVQLTFDKGAYQFKSYLLRVPLSSEFREKQFSRFVLRR